MSVQSKSAHEWDSRINKVLLGCFPHCLPWRTAHLVNLLSTLPACATAQNLDCWCLIEFSVVCKWLDAETLEKKSSPVCCCSTLDSLFCCIRCRSWSCAGRSTTSWWPSCSSGSATMLWSSRRRSSQPATRRSRWDWAFLHCWNTASRLEFCNF